jgi:hypothetical protein
MKRKLSTETPVCPQERLVIISYTTGLSFVLERIGPLTAITIIVFYLLVLYLLPLSNTPENPFASIYSESLITTSCQHLLLLVGFDTLIYRKYNDTPPIDAWLMTSPLGTPRGRCDEYSSKIFPQLRNQGLSFLERRDKRLKVMWTGLIALQQGRRLTILVHSSSASSNAEPAHTHNQVLCSQLAMRLSISPVCLKQRI